MRGAGRAADRRLAAAHASAHVSPVASGKSPAGESAMVAAGESAMVTAGESAMVTAKTTAVGAATVETTTSPAVEAASTPAAMAAPTMLGPNELGGANECQNRNAREEKCG